MRRTVTAIAQEAGDILLRYWRQDPARLRTRFKDGKFDPVTAADLAADEHIRRGLAAAFPRDQILTEEHDATIDWRGRVWVVDPLDGTKYFVRGAEWFTVHIGLVVAGVPVLGAVHAPASGATYIAERGKGAFLIEGGRTLPLRVSARQRLDGASAVVRLNIGDARPYEPFVRELVARRRIAKVLDLGAGLKLCALARGDADFYINPSLDVKKWDTCAPHVVLEEAGGLLTDFAGRPLDYAKASPVWDRSFVASNGHLHGQLLQELAVLRK